MVLSRFYLPTGVVLGAAVVAVALGAGTASSSAIRLVPERAVVGTAAEQAFDDAPYGVDPMVTGPTSAAFRQKQDALNCDAATWPDVPLGCFPG